MKNAENNKNSLMTDIFQVINIPINYTVATTPIKHTLENENYKLYS